jgi:hypothetical protein
MWLSGKHVVTCIRKNSPAYENGVALMTVMLVVRLAAVAVTKVVVEEGMLFMLAHAFGRVPSCVRCLWQPPYMEWVIISCSVS